MSLIVVGQLCGALFGSLGGFNSAEGTLFAFSGEFGHHRAGVGEHFMTAFLTLFFFGAFTPVASGFVVVGLMIKQFGSCVGLVSVSSSQTYL